jgi:hypothetical protein
MRRYMPMARIGRVGRGLGLVWKGFWFQLHGRVEVIDSCSMLGRDECQVADSSVMTELHEKGALCKGRSRVRKIVALPINGARDRQGQSPVQPSKLASKLAGRPIIEAHSNTFDACRRSILLYSLNGDERHPHGPNSLP